MPDFVIEIPELRSLLAHHGIEPEHPVVEALLSREDSVKEALYMLGMEFGLHSEIVAHILTNVVPLGHAPSDEARHMIHDNYHRHIEALIRQQREGDGS